MPGALYCRILVGGMTFCRAPTIKIQKGSLYICMCTYMYMYVYIIPLYMCMNTYIHAAGQIKFY